MNKIIEKYGDYVRTHAGKAYYRKKPVIVSAIELDEDIEILTLEGTLVGKKGDYLIEGVKGEIYPCRKDIFHQTYERL